jgi:hypothetical protein
MCWKATDLILLQVLCTQSAVESTYAYHFVGCDLKFNEFYAVTVMYEVQMMIIFWVFTLCSVLLCFLEVVVVVVLLLL